MTSAPQSQLSDVNTLRQRARQNVENGAVTEGYSADRETVLRLLNESLRPSWFASCATSATTTWRPA